MADAQVTCVNKDATDVHEGITHLGGASWRWPRADVIASIEAGTNTFFTSVDGKRANIEVREGKAGKFLQTKADGAWNNNLLSLTSCPIR